MCIEYLSGSLSGKWYQRICCKRVGWVRLEDLLQDGWYQNFLQECGAGGIRGFVARDWGRWYQKMCRKTVRWVVSEDWLQRTGVGGIRGLVARDWGRWCQKICCLDCALCGIRGFLQEIGVGDIRGLVARDWGRWYQKICFKTVLWVVLEDLLQGSGVGGIRRFVARGWEGGIRRLVTREWNWVVSEDLLQEWGGDIRSFVARGGVSECLFQRGGIQIVNFKNNFLLQFREVGSALATTPPPLLCSHVSVSEFCITVKTSQLMRFFIKMKILLHISDSTKQ